MKIKPNFLKLKKLALLSN